MSDKDEFAKMIQGVAQELWGEPNKALSKPNELRYGNQGSRVINLDRGIWFDNEDKVGGGTIQLVERETGLKGREAVQWLKDRGYDVPENSDYPQRGNQSPRPKSRAAETKTAPKGNQPPAQTGDKKKRPRGKITAKYDYTDEHGTLVFQVCRDEVVSEPGWNKTFRQRQPDPEAKGGWNWKVKGVRQVPYQLQEVLQGIRDEKFIYITEGEKDVDNLRKMGLVATCNAGGAGKWPEGIIEYFRNADVVILPDNDKAGTNHRNFVANALFEVANQIRWLDLPKLGPKQDVTDWIEAGGTADDLQALVESVSDIWTPAVTFESSFNAVTWKSLDDPGAEHEWLIKNLLTRQEISMVAGPSQAGKSFLALDIALSIARGTDFFGYKTVRRGGVVYQAGEGGRGIKKRLRAYRDERGLSLEDDVPFVLLPCPIDLHASDDHTDKMIKEIEFWSSQMKHPLELVVIDTLSAATPGARENDSQDMSIVLKRCGRIATATRAHVMLVHHLNADGTKIRGHTSIFANLENVIIVRKTEENDAPVIVEDYRTGNSKQVVRPLRNAVVEKQKDGEDGAAISFVLKSVRIGEDEDGDPITSCVCEPPQAGALDNVPVKEVSGFQPTAECAIYLKAIYQEINASGVHAPQGSKAPTGTLVVNHTDVRKRFETMAFEGDGEDVEARHNKIMKAIQRHGAKLFSQSIIDRETPYIWLTGRKVRGFGRPPGVVERAKTKSDDELFKETKEGTAEALPFDF